MIEASELERLVLNAESFRVELTESRKDTEKFCEAICAFSNDMPGSGLPGYLIVGVNRGGEPTGITVDDRLLESLAGLRDNGNILPIPTMDVFKATFKNREVAVVRVQPSTMPPVRYNQVVWIRTGPSKDRATSEQERRLEERRVDRSRTWDMRACEGSTLGDLALDLFKLSYLPNAVSREVLEENGRSVKEQLGSLRMYHSRIDAPTNAAILLFGKDPLAFVPGAYVQYVRYDGLTQADTPLEERRISGDLVTVMRGLDAMARDLAVERPVRSEDLREVIQSDYPKVAVHELFMNSVIHRNYDGSTTPISVNHFTDRLEIQNPGSLYGDLSRDQFPEGGTSYRNPVLAEAAKIHGFANRFGRGIARARSELNRNGSPPLEYVVGTNHLLMIVRRRV